MALHSEGISNSHTHTHTHTSLFLVYKVESWEWVLSFSGIFQKTASATSGTHD